MRYALGGIVYLADKNSMQIPSPFYKVTRNRGATAEIELEGVNLAFTFFQFFEKVKNKGGRAHGIGTLFPIHNLDGFRTYKPLLKDQLTAHQHGRDDAVMEAGCMA